MTDAAIAAAKVFVVLGVLFVGWVVFIYNPGADTAPPAQQQVEQRYYSA